MAEEIQGLNRLLSRVRELALDTSHTEKPLRVAGALLVASIQRNFSEQGRPQKWPALAASTIARRRKGKGKGGAKILIDSARMKNSIGYKMVSSGGEPAVKVGTNVIYAARQHFGFKGGGGRGHEKTPSRKFMLVQPEDIDAIGRVFRRHVERK